LSQVEDVEQIREIRDLLVNVQKLGLMKTAEGLQKQAGQLDRGSRRGISTGRRQRNGSDYRPSKTVS
jgi:hypothetical protein